MKNKSIFYQILILVILFQSCASFDKKLTNPNPLNKENLTELNGQYGIVALKFDSISKESSNPVWQYNNFLTEIDRKLIKDTLKIDRRKTYMFDLKIISPKKIKIGYLENGVIFRERLLRYEIRKDGYIYLKNKNLQLMLIPLIAGAIDVKKTRLTKSENGNLILDVVNFRYGSALIVIGDAKNWKYRQEFKPIE